MVSAVLPSAVQWTYPTLPTVLGISPTDCCPRPTSSSGGSCRARPCAAVAWTSQQPRQPSAGRSWAGDSVAGSTRSSHPSQFETLWQVSAAWRRGMALIGGVVAGLASLRRRRVPILPALDSAALPLAAGIALGRVGDLMLGDHLGRPLTAAWGLGYVIQPGSALARGPSPSPARGPQLGESCPDVAAFYAGCAYHVTRVYQLVGAAIALILLALARWTRRLPRAAISIFTVLYAGQRLASDAARGIAERPFGRLTGTQLIAVAVVTWATVALAVSWANHHRSIEAPKAHHEGTGRPASATDSHQRETLSARPPSDSIAHQTRRRLEAP